MARRSLSAIKQRQSGPANGSQHFSMLESQCGAVVCKGGKMAITLSAHAERAGASVDAVEYLMEQLTVAGSDPASQAAEYHLRSGGSRVRCRLGLHAGQMLDLKPSAQCAIAAACELLHNASLIHDDLQDQDRYRRGSPCVWVKFGSDTALCTGDLFISAAYAALAPLAEHTALPPLMVATHHAVAQAVRGQVADTTLLNASSANVDAYLDTVSRKSGALLDLPQRLSLMASGHFQSLTLANDAVMAFAKAYQILDDLDDWQDDQKMGRLNAVSVLQQQLGCSADHALARAGSMAHDFLDGAARNAGAMPQDSGAMIVAYSQRMKTKIPTELAA